MSVDGTDVKFLGIVQSYNEAKKSGIVACQEAQLMWGQDLYAYKDVLAAASANVGDVIRFGIHVNARGQPQVSLPVYRVGEDGVPIDVPEGTEWVNAEELAAKDPGYLEKLKGDITSLSERTNRKRSKPMASSNGAVYPTRGGRQRVGRDTWGAPSDTWGAGMSYEAAGGSGWGNQEISLFVSGVPLGIARRELLHIFRQYAGFVSLRQVEREDHTLVFVSFATHEQAQFVMDALNGYVFDTEVPPDQQSALTLAPAKEKLRQ